MGDGNSRGGKRYTSTGYIGLQELVYRLYGTFVRRTHPLKSSFLRQSENANSSRRAEKEKKKFFLTTFFRRPWKVAAEKVRVYQ